MGYFGVRFFALAVELFGSEMRVPSDVPETESRAWVPGLLSEEALGQRNVLGVSWGKKFDPEDGLVSRGPGKPCLEFPLHRLSYVCEWGGGDQRRGTRDFSIEASKKKLNVNIAYLIGRIIFLNAIKLT